MDSSNIIIDFVTRRKIQKQRAKNKARNDSYVNRSWVFKQAYKKYGDSLYGNRVLFDKLCVLERQAILKWDMANHSWI